MMRTSAMIRSLTRLAASAILLLALGTPALADYDLDIDFLQPPAEDELEDLSMELAGALMAPVLVPAEPLGLLHFDLSGSGTVAKIDRGAPYWLNATSGNAPSEVVVVRGRARVGLPFSMDAGLSYGRVQGSGEVVDADIKWAFFKGGTLAPAMAVRAAYTELRDVDQLDFHATSLDVSISKGFGFFTPFGGVGGALLDSKAHNIPGFPGQSQSASTETTRVYAGARLSLAFFNGTLQWEHAGGIDAYSVRLGFIFP